jgi:hypothetical protein
MYIDYHKMTRLMLLLFCFANVATFAQNPSPVVMTASGGLTHNLVRKLLPLQAKVAAGDKSLSFWFADLYFCGADSAGTKAKVLGIAYPGTAAPQAPSPILVGGDCKDDFTGLKNRIKPPAGAFIAATLSMSWVAWNVSFSITQADAVGNASPELTNLRSALATARTPVASFSTAGLSIHLAENTLLVLDAAISFDRDSTLVTLFVSGKGAAAPQPAAIAQLPVSINSHIQIPYDFLNFVLKTYFPGRHFVLSNTDAGTVEFTDPQASFDLDQFAVRGILRHVQSGQEFPITLYWSGADLTVAFVKLEAQLENCAPNDMDCRLRNGLRTSLASKVQTRLQALYHGVPFRPTNFNEPVAFVALGIPMQAHVQTVQGSANTAALELNEIITLERK